MKMIVDNGVYDENYLARNGTNVVFWISSCIERRDYSNHGLRYQFIGEGECECGTRSFYFVYRPTIRMRTMNEYFVVIVLTQEEVDRYSRTDEEETIETDL